MQHTEGEFKGYKDLDIYYQCWLPEGKARAVLLVVHGWAEHSGALHKPGRLLRAQRLRHLRS